MGRRWQANGGVGGQADGVVGTVSGVFEWHELGDWWMCACR